MARPYKPKVDETARPIWDETPTSFTSLLTGEEAEETQAQKKQKLLSNNYPTVYFDIQINGVDVGRIVMALRSDIVPKTTKNFIELCNHEQGFGFRKSLFHRIIPGFMLQGIISIDVNEKVEILQKATEQVENRSMERNSLTKTLI